MPHAPKEIGQEVTIPLPKLGVTLKGFLAIPENAEKIIVFAHGSGSGRHSPRNQSVARFLIEHQLSTLLVDLLTHSEEAADMETREFRFNIPLLAERLLALEEWLGHEQKTRHLKIGYFGSSTGAAAALIAAAKGQKAYAVVSRGGRPDLAAAVLSKVTAPTLLIVGGDDEGVIELNQNAFAMLRAEKKLDIVPGATHLFEEPGKLEEVARLAAGWFISK